MENQWVLNKNFVQLKQRYNDSFTKRLKSKMTTRRNFLKGVGVAMAATPFTALMLGSKNAEAAPEMVQVCLRCVQRETPCFCHTQRLCGRVSLPSCPWYAINDDRFDVGDTYENSLDSQTYTYTAGEDGYPNFWQPSHGLMCPACSQRARKDIFVANNHFGIMADYVSSRDLHGYDRMLSIACNTWPPYTDKWEGKCCCGHPWLKTATEDYARWLKGESDSEREYRRNYPTVRLWKKYRRHYGMFDTPPAIMGVDQIAPCDTLRYHYRIPNGSGDGTTDWNELANIMRNLQIQMCVIDPNPDRFQAVKFRRLFPGHVVFCQYRRCLEIRPGVGTTLMGNFTNNLSGDVFADRSYWYRGDHPAAFCEIARELECDRRCM